MINRELAESTKESVYNYLLELDRYLFSMYGPYESFNTLLYNYGYHRSKHIMDDIVPTGIFSKDELEILTNIENLIMKLIDEYDSSGIQGWSFLTREQYLELKGYSYDYLKLVQEKKEEW